MLDPDEKKNIKQVAEFIRSLIEQRISVKCLSQKLGNGRCLEVLIWKTANYTKKLDSP